MKDVVFTEYRDSVESGTGFTVIFTYRGELFSYENWSTDNSSGRDFYSPNERGHYEVMASPFGEDDALIEEFEDLAEGISDDYWTVLSSPRQEAGAYALGRANGVLMESAPAAAREIIVMAVDDEEGGWEYILVCPHCLCESGEDGDNFREVDECVRWNELSFDIESASVVSYQGDGDFETTGWRCDNCEREDLKLPIWLSIRWA
jgi:hypothetical protein